MGGVQRSPLFIKPCSEEMEALTAQVLIPEETLLSRSPGAKKTKPTRSAPMCSPAPKPHLPLLPPLHFSLSPKFPHLPAPHSCTGNATQASNTVKSCKAEPMHLYPWGCSPSCRDTRQEHPPCSWRASPVLHLPSGGHTALSWLLCAWDAFWDWLQVDLNEPSLRQEAGLSFALDSRVRACNVLAWARGKRQRGRGVEMKFGLSVVALV